MRQKLYNISDKIDGLTLEILKKIKLKAVELEIDFFLVGATVRDIILNYVYNITVYRKTNDIDFAIRIRNWDEYYRLTTEIQKIGFEKNELIMQRYKYNGMIIDFIPFGEISLNKKTIVWPDGSEKEMNIIGFDDAFQNTEDLIIQSDPEIKVKVASVIALVVLKIFAWNDRSIDLRIKDAKDLYLIISTYIDAGNQERLYDHLDIVEQAEDYELSGAILLGRDIKNSISAKLLEAIIEILSNENLQSLANDMSRYENLHRETEDEKVKWCVELLTALKLEMQK